MILTYVYINVETGNVPYRHEFFKAELSDTILEIFKKLNAWFIFDSGLTYGYFDCGRKLEDALIELSADPTSYAIEFGMNDYNEAVYLLANLLKIWRMYPNARLYGKEL